MTYPVKSLITETGHTFWDSTQTKKCGGLMRSGVADQQKQTANKDEPFLSAKKTTRVIRTSVYNADM